MIAKIEDMQFGCLIRSAGFSVFAASSVSQTIRVLSQPLLSSAGHLHQPAAALRPGRVLG